jgi:WD40 repeat protein
MSNFPYPGLRPFKCDEAHIFFGRDDLSNQLIKKLGDTHFLAVVGLSGSGKSSLIRTGLLPGLEKGFLPRAGVHWRVAEFRPGNRPFFRLADALLVETALKEEYTAQFTDSTDASHKKLEANLRRGPLGLHEILQNSPLPQNTNLLVVIDQFEEIFRHYQQGDGNEFAAFVRLLLESSKHPAVYVVITMRSEFLGDCTSFEGLSEAINKGLFLTPHLTREQLRLTIEGPAKVFGGQVEPRLVNHLLNEMNANIDGKSDTLDRLPVLQHALMRMWTLAEKEKSPILTLKHYEKIGGLANALSQHADEAYKLSSSQQEIAKILFCSLSEIGGRHSDTRHPIALSEVAALANVSDSEVADVVKKFQEDNRHFLMPPLGTDLKPNTVLDISHESLIRQWQRLQKWLEPETEAVKIYRRLEDNACRWKEKQAGLYTGVELDIALRWRKKFTANWAKRYGKEGDKHLKLAMDFLKESERKKQRKQKVAVAFSILAIVLTGLALWKTIQANFVKKQIEYVQKEKAKRTLSLFESQLTHAVLSAQGEDYARAKKILRKTRELDSEIRPERPERLHTRNLLDRFNKIMGGASQKVYQEAGAPLFAVAASPDGTLLAAAGEKGTLLLFNLCFSSSQQHLQGHTENVKAVVFHPHPQQDERFASGKWLLASAGDDKRIILWSHPTDDTLEFKEKLKFERKLEWEAPGKVRALAVSPDGKDLASGGTDKDITLWNPETGKKIERSFKGHKGTISGLAFSPDGKYLASASYDNTARLWEVKTGKVLQTLDKHDDHVQKVAFSPDGQLLATSSRDTTVRLWKVDFDSKKVDSEGKRLPASLLHVLRGHKNTVFSVGFVEKGRYLVSASRDRTLRLWDTETGVTMRVLQGHTASVSGIAILKKHIYSASNDGLVMRWNYNLPYQYEVNLPNKSEEQAYSTAIAPDGNSVAVGFADGTLRLYALQKSRSKPRYEWKQGYKWEPEWSKKYKEAHGNSIPNITFNPKGTLLASASFDGTVKLWKVNSHSNKGDILQEQQTFNHQEAHVNAVAFSPDGNTLAHQVHVNAVTFSPDGNTLATVSNVATYDYDDEKWTYSDGQIGLFTVGTNQKRFFLLHEWEPLNHEGELNHEWEQLNSVSFNKTGEQLLSTSEHNVRLWNISNWKNWKNGQRKPLQEYPESYDIVAWSSFRPPKSQQIASVGRDQLVRIYDTTSKYTEYSLAKHDSTVLRVIFSPNGKLAATVSTDATLRLWDLVPKGGRELFALRLPTKISDDSLWDFDFSCTETKDCWIAVPLTMGKLMLYDFRGIDKDKESTTDLFSSFFNADVTDDAIKRATWDKKALDERAFPYMRPLLSTYWNQNTTIIQFIAEQEKGKLKGKTIANVYHHSEYGKETIPMLEAQAKEYGFTLKHFPIKPPEYKQKSTWKQIKDLNPDWIILRGWEEMTRTALKEAQDIKFPADHIVGVNWSPSKTEMEEAINTAMEEAGDAAMEEDRDAAMEKAKKAAKDFITALNPSGGFEKVIKDSRKFVGDKNPMGSMDYIHGIVTAILKHEAIRTATEKFCQDKEQDKCQEPLTSEQVRWGLEHLNLTEKRIKELGAEGLISPIKTSCADHEGGGEVKFQQWDGKEWKVISDWITPDDKLARQMVEESAKEYADEKEISLRDCTEE